MPGELLINLWDPANSLFVLNIYVMPIEKRLNAGYVRKQKHAQKYHLTPTMAVNNTCIWINDELIHTQDNYFDSTVYIQQSFTVVQKKPRHRIFQHHRC